MQKPKRWGSGLYDECLECFAKGRSLQWAIGPIVDAGEDIINGFDFL